MNCSKNSVLFPLYLFYCSLRHPNSVELQRRWALQRSQLQKRLREMENTWWLSKDTHLPILKTGCKISCLELYGNLKFWTEDLNNTRIQNNNLRKEVVQNDSSTVLEFLFDIYYLRAAKLGLLCYGIQWYTRCRLGLLVWRNNFPTLVLAAFTHNYK